MVSREKRDLATEPIGSTLPLSLTLLCALVHCARAGAGMKRAHEESDGTTTLSPGSPSASPTDAPLPDTDADESYDVERIVDARMRKGQREYLIKWEGFGDRSNTWEPERNLSNNSVFLQWRRGTRAHACESGDTRRSCQREHGANGRAL